MPNNKLPAYFEKYFEQKFGEIQAQIAELKNHVNDELADLKQIAKTNQGNITKLWLVVILLIAYHVLFEENQNFWGLIKSFI